MSGFATHLARRRKHRAPGTDKAESERFRVVRLDGVTLAGTPDKAVAERIRRVICTGQGADYAVVMGGGR